MALGTLSVGDNPASGFSDTERNYVKNAKECLILFGRSSTGTIKPEEVVKDVQVLFPQSTRFMPLWTVDQIAVKDIIPSLQAFAKKNGLNTNPSLKYLIHYS